MPASLSCGVLVVDLHSCRARCCLCSLWPIRGTSVAIINTSPSAVGCRCSTDTLMCFFGLVGPLGLPLFDGFGPSTHPFF